MGRRSRKRSAAPVPGDPAPARSAPAVPPPAALRRRAPSAQRPPAPWGAFPLGELATLAGIVLIVGGYASASAWLLAAGFSLVALAAAELAAREHYAGFRSHSALLAMILAAVTAVVLVLAGAPRALQVGLALAAFLAGFWLLRRAFRTRTGGLGFRA